MWITRMMRFDIPKTRVSCKLLTFLTMVVYRYPNAILVVVSIDLLLATFYPHKFDFRKCKKFQLTIRGCVFNRSSGSCIQSFYGRSQSGI